MIDIDSSFGDMARSVSRSDLGVRETANDIRDKVRRSMSPGRSQPGSPPGIDTGAYRDSFTVTGNSEVAEIHTHLPEQFKALEFGTERLAPRPHIRPEVLKASVDKITKAFRNAL